MLKLLLVECLQNWGESYYVMENHRLRIMNEYLNYKYLCKQIDCNAENIKLYQLLHEINKVDLCIFIIGKSNKNTTLKVVEKACLSGWHIYYNISINENSYLLILLYKEKYINEDFLDDVFNAFMVSNNNSYGNVSPLFIGRNIDKPETYKYINKLFMNGGMIEVLRSSGCGRDCDNCIFKCKNISFSTQGNKYLKEQITVLSCLNVKKVCINDWCFLSNKYTNDQLYLMLWDFYKKTGLQFSIQCCYKNIIEGNIARIVEYHEMFFSITLCVDLLDDENIKNILSIQKFMGNRIKLSFIIFRGDINLSQLRKQISVLFLNSFRSSPDYLLKKQHNLQDDVIVVYNIISIIYVKILLSLHRKIITYENMKKKPYRNGHNKDYDEIQIINKEIAEMGYDITKLTYDILMDVIDDAEKQIDEADIFNKIIKKYYDRIIDLNQIIERKLTCLMI